MKFLCDCLGKRRTFLVDVRNGNDHLDSAELSIIADKLHTTTDYLIGATDDPSPPTQPSDADAATPEQLAALDPATRRIFELFNALPDDKRQEALHYIEYIIARSHGDTDDRR